MCICQKTCRPLERVFDAMKEQLQDIATDSNTEIQKRKNLFIEREDKGEGSVVITTLPPPLSCRDNPKFKR